jgi:tRNA-splicing ligase RtcB
MLEVSKNKVPIKSWCMLPESGALDQASNVANLSKAFHHVALMPDTHSGYGMPIGGVCALDGAISPNMVGVDIACGMMAVKTDLTREMMTPEVLKQIIVQVRRDVPMGMSHQKDDRYKREAINLYDAYADICKGDEEDDECNNLVAIYSQLGTLGGGNHFIEFQVDEQDAIWLMIHSGSRNIGKRVCDKYNKIAMDWCTDRKHELPDKELAYLDIDSRDGMRYLHAMLFCIAFSFKNRELMVDAILKGIDRSVLKGDIGVTDKINIHHNYASYEEHFGKKVWVHRKGATSARKDQLGIIPGSMGTSSYIVKGLGNPESFTSCSHGAGRAMSRGDAKRKFTVDDFKKAMEGTVSLDIDQAHIDESPMAYKDIDTVMTEQMDLVEIVHMMKPLATMKG